MHGRPRIKASDQDPAKVQAAQEKAALLSKLLAAVLQRRKEKRYDPESLALAAKLLELNPEIYTVWNYRREAIGPLLEQGGEEGLKAVKEELELTQRALMRNPKSYSTWHHRRWIVGSGFCSLEAEMVLVGKLLDADERNFHGWGYRRFIAERMGMPVQTELDFTTLKIEQNFSNYSAWHYRTSLLPLLYSEPGPGPGPGTVNPAPAPSASATASIPLATLTQEYNLVKQALYTEPEDQSGWFYHRWLLGCSLARWQQAQGTTEVGGEQEGLLQTLDREMATCRELLEVEPNSKWPLLTMTRLQELHRQVLLGSEDAGTSAGTEARLADIDQEIQAAYKTLEEEDSLRAGYYLDAAEGNAHVVAIPKAVSLPTQHEQQN